MFYLLDKEKGITSFKAIKNFSRENNIKKIGHTGTLDPLATGLLLVATDDDTKLIDYIDKGFKTYRASMALGKTSDTYDSEGIVTEVTTTLPDNEDVVKALNGFVGTQEQMPPIFSAKKVNGQRAYDLARKGEKVILKTSTVTIKDISNIVITDVITFDVTVSRGTYIRSIIHDLGQNLGCGAIMTDLRRTEIGTLTEKQIGGNVDIFDLLTLPLIEIGAMKRLVDGKTVQVKEEDGKYALKYNEDVFGIVSVKGNIVKPIKLFGNKFRKAGF